MPDPAFGSETGRLQQSRTRRRAIQPHIWYTAAAEFARLTAVCDSITRMFSAVSYPPAFSSHPVNRPDS